MLSCLRRGPFSARPVLVLCRVGRPAPAPGRETRHILFLLPDPVVPARLFGRHREVNRFGHAPNLFRSHPVARVSKAILVLLLGSTFINFEHLKNEHGIVVPIFTAAFCNPDVRTVWAHMGTDFYPEGGKNASKSEVPPKMALGEG